MDENQPRHLTYDECGRSFPFSSHPASLHTLVRKLAAAAPDVTFSFFSTAKSNGLIFWLEDNGLDKSKSLQCDRRGLQCDRRGSSKLRVYRETPEEFIELFTKATPRNFKRAIDGVVEEKKITCVMSDTFLWFAGEMAEEMKVPWVPLWIAGQFSLSAHFYTDLIRRMIGTGPDATAGREDEPLNFIPGMSRFRIRDLQEGIVFGDVDSPFSNMLHRMGQMLPRAAAVAINSVEELNPTITDDLKKKFQNCLNVGPFSFMSALPSDPDVNGCLSWLDGQKAASVAYIGFEVWEIGVGMEGGVITIDGMMRGLDLILSEEKGKKMRGNIGALNELMGKAVGAQGSSSENFKILLEIVSRGKMGL
ncbi:hypothetical protein HHK36_013664 [Tetracentron sinense]|uniref:Uncharacterized protein n=1 Tax=Tetracentron sinense TaxID=13715 RepID=A0A835DEM7_TETSI|nr:hypothetical protein HHK36_013664 [Tetracentron sinense]